MTDDEEQDRIRRDLTQALTEDMQLLVNRRATLASSMLGTAQIAVMLTTVASSMLCGAMIFALQHKNDDIDADELLKDVVRSAVNIALSRKPAIIAVAAALNAGAGLTEVKAVARNNGVGLHG